MKDSIEKLTNNEYIQERTCTRKRAFQSLAYCLSFADYLSDDQISYDGYKCPFCLDFHLTKKTMTPEQINNLFSYHSPKPGQPERYNLIREKAKELALTIIENTPSSAEQTLAVRSLHQSVMQANAAIAVNE